MIPGSPVAVCVVAYVDHNPERMQAIPGPWPSLIREVQSIILGERGFGENLDWGTDRGRDFQCLATIIYLIDCQPSTNTTFPGAVKLEKWLQTNKPVPEKTRAAVLETFHIFVALVKDKKYKVAFQKPSRVAPVEFSVIGLLIYLNKEKFSFVQLSQAIWQLRADVRKEHADVRANNKVTKTMFSFLHKRLKQANLPNDGKGDTPAAIAIRQQLSGVLEDGMIESEPRAPKAKKEKRRRMQESESTDNSENEKAPSKRRASMPSAASSNRASSSKTSMKTSTSRKVSAPTVPAKAIASKSASKASAKIAKFTAPSSPTQSTASTSSQTTASAAAKTSTKVTKRTTRTALAAAGDVLFPPEPSAFQQSISASLAETTSPAKTPKKGPSEPSKEEAVVKMEVDTSASISLEDNNAMWVVSQVLSCVLLGSTRSCRAVDEAPPEIQVRSALRNVKQMLIDTFVNNRLLFRPSSSHHPRLLWTQVQHRSHRLLRCRGTRYLARPCRVQCHCLSTHRCSGTRPWNRHLSLLRLRLLLRSQPVHPRAYPETSLALLQ